MTTIGSKCEVYNGTADCTQLGQRKGDLMENKQGEITNKIPVIGTIHQVYNGLAVRTKGWAFKDDMMVNWSGKVVTKKAHKQTLWWLSYKHY